MNRLKISITLPADLVERIDEEAGRTARANRSAVIERWLRAGARRQAGERLREATIAYYDSLRAEERADDAAYARAVAESSLRLRYDD
ncbi:MAG: ribbon-helix-helix protein, CopG family [Planctomycetes bacterium]|nr:ribbon-helix-helix protein, CopG family [Planctomycetota bacterium]